VRSLNLAGAFIDDVGFALLFPARGVELPCLFNAATDHPAESVATIEWEPDGARVWGWKDELPLHGLAWSGKFLRGRASFLSPVLLADLYPRSGIPEDFAEAALSTDARHVAEILLLSGPSPTVALREALGLEGKQGQTRFAHAATELARALVVTNYGTQDVGRGWPSTVLELTARAFPKLGRGDDRRAAEAFLDTMVEARPADLARAFGWPVARARASVGSYRWTL
jgi:hypothetical protein